VLTALKFAGIVARDSRRTDEERCWECA